MSSDNSYGREAQKHLAPHEASKFRASKTTRATDLKGLSLLRNALRSLQICISATSLMLLSGCSKKGELADFTSDGCSLFPDRSLIDNTDWCACCLEHDIAYWQGGTFEERQKADEKLRDCVLTKTGDSKLAETMFLGVRAGGSPWFYNWYRWGYGWSYDRKYKALTLDEERLATKKLVTYFKTAEGIPCNE